MGLIAKVAPAARELFSPRTVYGPCHDFERYNSMPQSEVFPPCKFTGSGLNVAPLQPLPTKKLTLASTTVLCWQAATLATEWCHMMPKQHSLLTWVQMSLFPVYHQHTLAKGPSWLPKHFPPSDRSMYLLYLVYSPCPLTTLCLFFLRCSPQKKMQGGYFQFSNISFYKNRIFPKFEGL